MVDFSSISQAMNAYGSTKRLSVERESDAMATPFLPGETPKDNQPEFSAVLSQSLQKGKSAGYTGESISAQAIANKAELHELVTAVSNAELTLKTVVAVRDKVISAYQDIMRMPV